MMLALYDILIGPFAEYIFMKRALVTCVCMALTSAPIGVFLVFRRMSLMGEALSHGILPGIAVAYIIAGASLWTMTLGGVIAGLLIAYMSYYISKKTILNEDASFSALYILSLAVGIFLLSHQGGTLNLMHLLFGGVLAINRETLVFVTIVSTLSLGLLVTFFKALVYDCFDPLFMRMKKVNTPVLQGIFILLVVLNLVASCQALGTAMALGIMMIPAISARLLTHNLSHMIFLSFIFAVLSSYIGLLISMHGNYPSGPTIIMVTGFFYGLSFCATQLRKQYKRSY
jgi:zinc/manganese transport system permease protein